MLCIRPDSITTNLHYVKQCALCVSLSQHVPKILGTQRDAGTRLATVLRRRPFSACNKGNRRRLYAGKSVVGRCLLLEVIAQSLNRLIQLSSFKPRANRHNIVAQQLLTLLEVFVSVCTCLGDCNFWFLYCTLLCWCQLTSVL